MQTHKVIGGGGTQLHVIETGNRGGRPILFIHGLSQCSLCWQRQFNSDLDIRGHGLSDKPHDAYGDSRLWADDVDAVIRTLQLDEPILCGWSYGPLVILDYVRHYGEDAIGGMNFVGGITRLGSEKALSVITPEFLSLVPAFFSENTEESVRGLESLLRLCFSNLATADLYVMLGYNLSVPPYVRQALFSRSIDNDEVLATIRKPLLITHAMNDAIVKAAIVDQHRAAVPHAEYELVANCAHGCFWDDAAGFNQRLRTFTETLNRTALATAK
jgi:pimeloyl-ACP methyl ester carboxylesterase